MAQLISIRKETGTLSKDAVVSSFLTFDDLDNIKQAVEGAEDRIFLAWATVDARDKEGENIPIEEIIADQDILLNERGGPLTDSHSNAVVGRTLAYKVMRHPETGSLGVLHLNQVFNHQDLDHEVWNEIVNGERTGLSVGGNMDNAGQDVKFEPDPQSGVMTRVLHGFRQYETATVHNPANQFALNEAVSLVAKSYKPMKGVDLLFNELKKRFPNVDRNAFNNALKIAYPNSNEVPKSVSENIKKDDVHNTNIKSIERGEFTMDKEAKKEFDALTESISKIGERLNSLEKGEDEPKPKATDEELLKKQGSQKEDEEEKTEKASAPLEGSGDGLRTDPKAQGSDNNEQDVYKDQAAKLEKENAALKEELNALKEATKEKKEEEKPKKEVAKIVTTPRPDSVEKTVKVKSVVETTNDYALKIAKGEINPRWNEVHHKVRELKQGIAKKQVGE